MKVVVTGARGMLGEDVVEVLQKKHDLIPVDITGAPAVYLDITRLEAVLRFFETEKPDLVVHTAGWRDVDGCEEDQEKALLINTFGARNVALACKLNCAVMIHISTDYVYSGRGKKAVTEYSPTDPVNFYGYSKLKAEEEIMGLLDRFFILRLPFLFGRGGHKENNPLHRIISLLQKGDQVEVTADQICSPTHTLDVARVIEMMMDTEYYVLYNVSSSGEASRYDFFLELASLCGLDKRLLIPVNSKIKKAKRSHYTVFNALVYKNTFDTGPGHWRMALKECIDRIKVS